MFFVSEYSIVKSSKEVTIALDDKAFRYFDTTTGKFEVETGEYEISVAASASDVKLTAAVEVTGTAVPAAQNLPTYATGRITDVSDEEFTALLGRPIPDGSWTKEIDWNDPLSRLGDAKGGFIRMIFRALKKKMDSDPSDSMMLYVFHLPLRGMAKTTGGMITNNMVRDLLDMANGHGFPAFCRLIGHSISDKKKIKAYRAKLEK